MNESLKTKSNPTPKLLMKDHKKPNTNGEFPTRLVITTTNFTSIFMEVWYLGLKENIDNHQVNYKKYTITQASQVKEYWEKLDWKREKVTIRLNDAVAMYPSIKFPLVKKGWWWWWCVLDPWTRKACPNYEAVWAKTYLLLQPSSNIGQWQIYSRPWVLNPHSLSPKRRSSMPMTGYKWTKT